MFAHVFTAMQRTQCSFREMLEPILVHRLPLLARLGIGTQGPFAGTTG